MRTPLSGQKTTEREGDADDNRFVEQKQDQRMPDDFSEGLRNVEAKEQRAADLGDRRRAERDQQAELQRQNEKGRADRHARTRSQRDDSGEIENGGGRRADRREPEQFGEGFRRSPQQAGAVAQQRKCRDSEEIHGEIGRLARAFRGAAQHENRRAGKKPGHDRMLAAASRLQRREDRKAHADQDALEQCAIDVRFAAIDGHGFPPRLLLNPAFFNVNGRNQRRSYGIPCRSREKKSTPASLRRACASHRRREPL